MAKINLKRGLTDVVLYLIIFIVVQIIMMYAGAGIWAGIKGEGYQATLQAASTGGNAILTALVSVFSSVITLIIFLKTKWTPLTRGYLLSKPWGTLLWVALFSLGTIIPLSFLPAYFSLYSFDEIAHINVDCVSASLRKWHNSCAAENLCRVIGLFALIATKSIGISAVDGINRPSILSKFLNTKRIPRSVKT